MSDDESKPSPHHPIPDEAEVGREVFETKWCAACHRREAVAWDSLCNECGFELAQYRLSE